MSVVLIETISINLLADYVLNLKSGQSRLWLTFVTWVAEAGLAMRLEMTCDVGSA